MTYLNKNKCLKTEEVNEHLKCNLNKVRLINVQAEVILML